MNRSGIEKARKRLGLAKQHLERVRNAATYEEFEAAWYQLLIAGNSVDLILEAAAKEDPKSRPWYGGKVNLRRKDPLLSYMHQARNSDEHGIKPVTLRADAGILAEIKGGEEKSKILSQDGRVRGYRWKGGQFSLKVIGAHAQLDVIVDSRFGDEYPPPRSHLGKPLLRSLPYDIANVWVNYLEGLLDDCEAKVIS